MGCSLSCLRPIASNEDNIQHYKQRFRPICDPAERDELVWSLLLGTIWADPEPAILCKLLSCSQKMTDLVHEAYAGKLKLQITDEDLERSEFKELHCWITKHAVLLQELKLDVSPSKTQVQLTEGFRTATAGAHTPARQRPRQLPLSALHCYLPAMPALLHNLAGSCSLQTLVVNMAYPDSSWPTWHAVEPLHDSSRTCRATQTASPALHEQLVSCALARHTSLKQLVIMSKVGKVSQGYEGLCLALEHLTQLEMLALCAFQVQPHICKAMPTSLTELYIRVSALSQHPLQLQHLTQLQVLDLSGLHAGDVLPAALTSLYLRGASGGFVKQLQGLPQLQLLHIGACSSVEDLQQLPCLTQLRELRLSCNAWSLAKATQHSTGQHTTTPPLLGAALKQLQLHAGRDDDDDDDVSHFHGLPLSLFEGLFANSSSSSQLSSFALQDLWVDASAHKMAEQLEKLTALKDLNLSCIQFQPDDRATAAAATAAAAAQMPQRQDLQPLLRAVARLPDLRSLALSGLFLGTPAARCLVGATQLTAVQLRGCVLNAPDEQLLRQTFGTRLIVEHP